MSDLERTDLLLDQTADEILTEVFDVDHVFPPIFVAAERPKKRTWAEAFWSLFGFRRRTPPARVDQP